MLKITHLSKKFDHKKTLDDISFSVAPGEIALILGASGVGKSTLLRILNNLETADSGTVLLDDKQLDLSHVNQTHVIGMVFQQFNLFEHMTVQENIIFPLMKSLNLNRHEAEKRTTQLLKHYDLEALKNVYASQLSGGQKQRLALARTLALKPHVICLDEPTSALDPFLKDFVAHNIKDLAQQGYIVLVATHDISLIEKLPGTLYLLEKGKIVESVPQKVFFEKPDNYPALKHFMRKDMQ
ncbi:MAG: ATP-binding cassette domain-containing protein [Candidatus Babeliaceae bacterium]